MRNLTARAMLCCMLISVLPASMLAADTSAAMLYTNGTAWINGGSVPKSSAIFAGDLVQTKADSVANIKAPGTSVLVSSDSLVQYQGDALKLEHGGMNVGTSKSMAARIGGLKVVPTSSAWTEFEVRDTAVKIVARKGDLTLTDAEGTTTLAQGQETTRDETQEKGKKKRGQGPGAAPAAGGGILDSRYAIGIGAGAVTGLTVWVLLQDDEPISPKDPQKP